MTAISQDFKACRALDMPGDGSRKLLGAVFVIVSVDGENRALDIFEVRNNRPRPELWRQPNLYPCVQNPARLVAVPFIELCEPLRDPERLFGSLDAGKRSWLYKCLGRL